MRHSLLFGSLVLIIVVVLLFLVFRPAIPEYEGSSDNLFLHSLREPGCVGAAERGVVLPGGCYVAFEDASQNAPFYDLPRFPREELFMMRSVMHLSNGLTLSAHCFPRSANGSVAGVDEYVFRQTHGYRDREYAARIGGVASDFFDIYSTMGDELYLFPQFFVPVVITPSGKDSMVLYVGWLFLADMFGGLHNMLFTDDCSFYSDPSTNAKYASGLSLGEVRDDFAEIISPMVRYGLSMGERGLLFASYHPHDATLIVIPLLPEDEVTSLTIDGEDVLFDLAYPLVTASVNISPGTHELVVGGVARSLVVQDVLFTGSAFAVSVDGMIEFELTNYVSELVVIDTIALVHNGKEEGVFFGGELLPYGSHRFSVATSHPLAPGDLFFGYVDVAWRTATKAGTTRFSLRATVR